MSRRVCALLVLAGALMLARGAYIPAKAFAAQALLQSAWQKSREDGGVHKPWPWADTHPVARLSAPRHGVDLIALAGSSGSSLAFGPGHMSRSGAPGSRDTVVFGAHRDTHFRFLEQVEPGDTLILESAGGERVVYYVEGAEVADASETRLRFEEDTGILALVTCYPFDALSAGGSLRYVVSAKAVGASL